MDRIFKNWHTPCRRCKKELRTVEMHVISIGLSPYVLCKECAFRFSELKPIWAIEIQQFIRS